MKHKKIDAEFTGSAVSVGMDLNQDGEKSLSLKLNLSEGLQEAIKRGEKVKGAKLLDFGFEGTKLKLSIDTDQDGEKLLELEANLTESLDEAGIL